MVTPSLLERFNGQPNFVMEKEFPTAKNYGKPIVPMEMEKTIRTQLEKDYPGIPDCVDGRNNEELETVLVTHLKNVALQKSTAEHNFLVGLAYLDGIDMEVDNEKALSLIVDAAGKDLEEAIRKLVYMYHTGKGVQRDYYKSAEWQEKLVDLIRRKYQQGDYEQNDPSLVFVLEDLGDAYFELRQLEHAKQCYDEMRIVAERIYVEYGTGFYDLSVSYRNLGVIEEELGNLIEAYNYYEKAFEIDKKRAEETNTVESRQSLSVSYQRLGDILQMYNVLGAAKKYYKEALDIDKSLVEETNTAFSRRGLALDYVSLGDVERRRGYLGEAEQNYMSGLAISKKLTDETNLVESRFGLVLSYSRMGEVKREIGDLEEAKRYHEFALDISKNLDDEINTVESSRDLSICYSRLGEIEEELGNYKEADGYYTKALKITEKQANKCHTLQLYHDLAVQYYKVGCFRGKSYLQKSYDIWKSLTDRFPDDEEFARCRDIVAKKLSN